jgi:hypothetical protein
MSELRPQVVLRLRRLDGGGDEKCQTLAYQTLPCMNGII